MIADSPETFVLRRAFRIGRVTRGEVQEAYPEHSYSKAGLVLRNALAHWPSLLRRDGRAVVPGARASAPSVAGEADLMEALEMGLYAMRYTGFRPRELPVQQVRWTCSMPSKPGVMTTLTRAVATGAGLEIQYVGLRLGESARWRRVFPLGLEQMGVQWRLVAQSLDDTDYPVRLFVLARIRDAVVMTERLPGDFFAQSESDREVSARLVLDDRLSADQRTALADELCADGEGKVRLLERSLWEFERTYGHAEPHEHIVWPPVARLEKDE
jgi:hypothetical protein